MKLLSLFIKEVRRMAGLCDPPPGWWIETNGKKWCYYAPQVSPTFIRMARIYATRQGAVRAAWRRFREKEEEKEHPWECEIKIEKAKRIQLHAKPHKNT